MTELDGNSVRCWIGTYSLDKDWGTGIDDPWSLLDPSRPQAEVDKGETAGAEAKARESETIGECVIDANCKTMLVCIGIELDVQYSMFFASTPCHATPLYMRTVPEAQQT